MDFSCTQLRCYRADMRRWPIILLCLVLFAGAMLGVRAVLVVGLPYVLDPIGAAIGWPAAVGIAFCIGVAGLIFGTWPRDAQGRMRPLPRRR